MIVHNEIFVYCEILLFSSLFKNAIQSEMKSPKSDKPNIIIIVADDLVTGSFYYQNNSI